jgi:hypothetical protein
MASSTDGDHGERAHDLRVAVAAMTCVDSGSGVRPRCSQTYFSTNGSMLE